MVLLQPPSGTGEGAEACPWVDLGGVKAVLGRMAVLAKAGKWE